VPALPMRVRNRVPSPIGSGVSNSTPAIAGVERRLVARVGDGVKDLFDRRRDADMTGDVGHGFTVSGCRFSGPQSCRAKPSPQRSR
jgi:hypothetical protein